MLIIIRLLWVLAALWATVVAAACWTLLTHSTIFAPWIGMGLWALLVVGLARLLWVTFPRPEPVGRHEHG